MRYQCVWCLLIAALSLLPDTASTAQVEHPIQAIDLRTELPLDQLARRLQDKRVVFIGEEHDRYDHHLNQLAIIQRLYDSDPNLALGVEYFQQPFQSQVDDYIAGKTSEQDFLRATEYYSRWSYDYRLYAPIFRFAREHRIPVRALNVPRGLVSAVSKSGLDGVPAEYRIYLPHSMEPADPAYRERLREAFQAHPGLSPDAFEHFVQAQLVWDESMAESAAAYLNANPGRRLIILAGEGHILFGAGIPQRLERRIHASYATVLSSDGQFKPGMADFLLLSNEQDLPPAGTLNVELSSSDGECSIAAISPGPAQNAGLRPGDVILSIDGQPVKSRSDVKLALWNKKPEDTIHLEIRRRRFLGTTSAFQYDVKLAAPGMPSGSPAI